MNFHCPIDEPTSCAAITCASCSYCSEGICYDACNENEICSNGLCDNVLITINELNEIPQTIIDSSDLITDDMTIEQFKNIVYYLVTNYDQLSIELIKEYFNERRMY